MERKNRVFKICVWALFCLTALMGITAYADTQGLSVDVVCGYNGTAKYGASIPVTVEIKNEGGAFGGSVSLYTGGSTAYASDVVIGAGETKSVGFCLSEIANHSQIHITIKDTGGKTVYSRDSIVRVDSPSTPFVGVLSDDYGALSYFSNLAVKDQAYSMSYPTVVNLSKSLYSPDCDSLDMFDVLVINDFHTDTLTQGQGQLLKAWIEEGGTLLVGTGVNYQKTISGFINDYLGGTMGLVQNRTGCLRLESAGDSGGLSLDVLDIRLTDGSAFDDRLYRLARRGLGNVAVFQFDLAGPSLLGWEYRDYAMESIVNEILLNKAGEQEYYKIEDMSVNEIISNVYINDIPNIGRYIAALSAYILLLPLIYLVLKRKDKRHFIWIAVPVLSVLFGLVIYATGTGSRLKNPNLNYLCVLSPNGQGARETVYMGSTSPRNRGYGFSVNSEYRLSSINAFGYYNSRVVSGPEGARITIKRGAAANDVAVRYNSAFETYYIRAEKYNDSIGDLAVLVEYFSDGYRLSVANNTGLGIENAGIIIPDYGVIVIGSLAPGESAEFGEDDIRTGSGYGFDIASMIIPDPSPGEIEVSRQNQISVWCRYMYYGQYEPFFIGFTSGYAPSIGDNPHIDTAGDTMLVKSAEAASGGSEIYIPNIRSYLVGYDGSYGYLPDYLYESEPLFATYQFPDVAVDSFRIRNAEDAGLVSFLNIETGEYDMVLSGGDIMSGRLESYLDDSRTLKVKYEVDPGMGTAPLPIIAAFGAPAADR